MYQFIFAISLAVVFTLIAIGIFTLFDNNTNDIDDPNEVDFK